MRTPLFSLQAFKWFTQTHSHRIRNVVIMMGPLLGPILNPFGPTPPDSWSHCFRGEAIECPGQEHVERSGCRSTVYSVSININSLEKFEIGHI